MTAFSRKKLYYRVLMGSHLLQVYLSFQTLQHRPLDRYLVGRLAEQGLKEEEKGGTPSLVLAHRILSLVESCSLKIIKKEFRIPLSAARVLV